MMMWLSQGSCVDVKILSLLELIVHANAPHPP